MASRSKQTEIHPPPQAARRGSDRRGKVEAEFVNCYKYSVVDLQIIVCIRRHVTLVHSTVCISTRTQSRSELSADLIGMNVEVG